MNMISYRLFSQMIFLTQTNIQQAVQNVSIEERQANVGIEKHKNKNNQDVLIVVADPKPVVLEEELADKKRRTERIE